MIILRFGQADIVATVLSPVSNNTSDKFPPVWCRGCGIHENPKQGLITGDNNTGNNLLLVRTAPAINYRSVSFDTGEQLITSVNDTGNKLKISKI